MREENQQLTDEAPDARVGTGAVTRRTRPGRTSWWFWLYVLVLVLLVRLVVFWFNLQQPLALEEAESTLMVEPGQSLYRVASRLEDSNIIRSGFDLRVYARLRGLAEQIQAGEYRLTADLTVLDLLDKMVNGEVVVHQVRLPEGWTLDRALALLQSHERIEVTLPDRDPEAISAALALEGHPEGLFFPDTYQFTAGTTDIEILRRAHARMQLVLAEEWSRRAVGLPFETDYEALIMASIVEKETGLASERSTIAGVFSRRLQSGMRLQADPTVIYGLGISFDGNLRRADLRSPTPYNTYTSNGLPPTPIALPGRAAIAASLNPAPGDALYFVARGDGSHVFSANLEAHNEAVRYYQIEGRSETYRSAPPQQAEEQ